MNLLDTNAYKALNSIAQAFSTVDGFVPFLTLRKAAIELCEIEGLSKEQRQELCYEMSKHYKLKLEA